MQHLGLVDADFCSAFIGFSFDVRFHIDFRFGRPVGLSRRAKPLDFYRWSRYPFGERKLKGIEPNQALQANDHAVTADASGVAGVVVIAELERWAIRISEHADGVQLRKVQRGLLFGMLLQEVYRAKETAR